MVVILCNCIALPIFLVFGLYRAIFHFSSRASLLLIAKAALLYGLIIFLIYVIYGVEGVPRTIGIIQPILFFLLVGASRAFAQAWLSRKFHFGKNSSSLKKAFIYGAGHTGNQFSLALNNDAEIKIIGFLDDDDTLHKNYNEYLIQEIEQTPNVDLVLFRMVENYSIIPSIFTRDIKEGNIGISKKGDFDFIYDNIFKVNINDKELAGKEIYLSYDIKGIDKSTLPSRSINFNKVVDGYVVKFSNEWQNVEEKMSAAWLKNGVNTIFFTLPNEAVYNYKIKN